MAQAVSDAVQKQAQNHVETWVRSLFALHGYPAPGSDQLGGIVQQGMARISPEELRYPGAISTASLGQLDGLVRASVEVGKPRNMYGADAARAAQAAGGAEHGRGGMGFGYIDAMRGNSNARFRDLPASDGTKGSGTASSGSLVTPEFARSFAGTGVVGGNLRTFADVGLDRGTFNEFRKEGFSKAEIVDSAKDTKALGWKGKEDLSIAQHALPDARKAAIAVEQAKTPEELAKAQQQEIDAAKKAEALPDSDRRKHGTKRFFQHVIETSKRAERHKAVGASAERDDAAATKDHVGKSAALDKSAQDRQGKQLAKTSVASLAGAADALLDGPATAPAKPAPTKIAAAKPTTPSSTPS